VITYVLTGIFQSPAKVLVNTVNTVGVMGKGIAKEFKDYYPEMFTQYQRVCERGEFQVGQLWLFKTPRKWILNFPTKRHWRQPSRPEYIEAGLAKFVNTYAENSITSISFPMLGCGNGELDWEQTVQPLMARYLKKLPIEALIHLRGKDPFSPEHHDPAAMKMWLRSEPESLAFTEVWDDLCEIIKKQKTFHTLDRNLSFTVEIVSQPQNGIMIGSKGESFFVSEDALLDLWQQTRSMGFCMERTMPSGLDRYASYIVALLANLVYFKPIKLAKQDTNRSSWAIGLRLMPREHTQTPPPLQVIERV